MRRFKFRLQTLLNVRERLEDMAEQKLALKLAAQAEAEAKLKAILDEKERVLLSPITAAGNAWGKRLDLLLQRERYLQTLDEQAGRAQYELDVAKRSTEQARSDLVKARTDREVVSRLRQKALEAHRQSLLSTEQAQLDDLTLMRRKVSMKMRQSP
ncbi:MAG: flagellar export protein FliJ [Armatimonadetes bacterium]|nr:flagellar export protein FliJ [Armatimonadota bacterium]